MPIPPERPPTFPSTCERPSAGWLLLSALMTATGVFALLAPLAAGITLSLLFAWAVIIVGVVQGLSALDQRRQGSRRWHVLQAIVYIGGGVYLMAQPRLALSSLTVVFAVMLFGGAAFRLMAYLRLQRMPGSGWLLLDGLVTLVLAVMITADWPESSEWALGTLVGLGILINGVTGMMFMLRSRTNRWR
jgi:uncharacterized membrane protein HdeD (DUF308 family)